MHESESSGCVSAVLSEAARRLRRRCIPEQRDCTSATAAALHPELRERDRGGSS
jgi:hypothetical protein